MNTEASLINQQRYREGEQPDEKPLEAPVIVARTPSWAMLEHHWMTLFIPKRSFLGICTRPERMTISVHHIGYWIEQPLCTL